MKITNIASKILCHMLFLIAWSAIGALHATAEKELVIKTDKRQYQFGEPVVIEIKASELLSRKSFTFYCTILLDSDGKLSEAMPSITATAPKQKDPIYDFPASQQLVWRYKDKPAAFQPQPGLVYRIRIEMRSTDSAATKSFLSGRFIFVRGKASNKSSPNPIDGRSAPRKPESPPPVKPGSAPK